MKTRYKIAMLCVHTFVLISLPTITFLHYQENDLSYFDAINIGMTPLYLFFVVSISKQLIEERKHKV